jgi:hypothetical protein
LFNVQLHWFEYLWIYFFRLPSLKNKVSIIKLSRNCRLFLNCSRVSWYQQHYRGLPEHYNEHYVYTHQRGQIRCLNPPPPVHIFPQNELPSWSRSYGSWIYVYLCNQCISPLTLLVRTPLRQGVLDTTLCDKVCQWLATGRWFSPGTHVFSINKTDHHDTFLYNWNIVESGIKHH